MKACDEGMAWTLQQRNRITAPVLVGVLSVIVCLVAFASPASAAWSAPQRIVDTTGGDAGELNEARVAKDANGSAVVVWQHALHGLPPVSVEASTRSAGGRWSVSVRLTSGHYGVTRPNVVMDAHGEAIVVWSQTTRKDKSDTLRTALDVKIHRPNGRWGRTLVLPSSSESFRDDGRFAPDPAIALNDRGNATVAYRVRHASREYIALATHRPGGRWRHPILVLPIAYCSELEVARDERGETILAWINGTRRGTHTWVEALVLGSDDKPAFPRKVLSPTGGREGGHAEKLDLAADDRGDAVLSWGQKHSVPNGNEDQGPGPLEAATRQVGSGFTGPTKLLGDAPRLQGYSPSVAIAPDGEATALFTHYEPPPPMSETEDLTAEFATHPVGGSWSPPVRLSPRQDGEALQLASAPSGDLMALWRTGTPPEFRRIVTSLEPVGATTWQKPLPLLSERSSERAANTTLALADDDKATAAWTGYNKENGELLEVADYEPG
jgi:hypothetical protein